MLQVRFLGKNLKCWGHITPGTEREGKMYDSRTEEGMGSDLRWALEGVISKYTALPSEEYYKKGGVYDHLRGIIAAVYVEEKQCLSS